MVPAVLTGAYLSWSPTCILLSTYTSIYHPGLGVYPLTARSALDCTVWYYVRIYLPCQLPNFFIIIDYLGTLEVIDHPL